MKNPDVFSADVVCYGTHYKVKMLHTETWGQLTERVLACDGRHISDAEWELTARRGAQLPMSHRICDTRGDSLDGPLWPVYLAPRAGVTA